MNQHNSHLSTLRLSFGRIAPMLSGVVVAVACGDADTVPVQHCQDDFDCKGDRICVEGQCVGPDGTGTGTGGVETGTGDETGTTTEEDPSTSGDGDGDGDDPEPLDPSCTELNGEIVCAQASDPGPTPDEMLPGAVPPPPGPLPDAHSLNMSGFTIPNQGNCGSCVAFAVRSAMGLRSTAQINAFTDFSPAHVWDIAGYGSEHCDSGSSIYKVISDNGSQMEHTVPAPVWP